MNTNQSNPNPAAQALGRLGRGHKKTLSPEERKRRADWARGLAGKRKPMKAYRIYTDNGSEEIQAANLADALREWGESPADVLTAQAFEAWLEKAGGYGGIQEDGVQIANVRP